MLISCVQLVYSILRLKSGFAFLFFQYILGNICHKLTSPKKRSAPRHMVFWLDKDQNTARTPLNAEELRAERR